MAITVATTAVDIGVGQVVVPEQDGVQVVTLLAVMA